LVGRIRCWGAQPSRRCDRPIPPRPAARPSGYSW
jgi:hypothetical protein